MPQIEISLSHTEFVFSCVLFVHIYISLCQIKMTLIALPYFRDNTIGKMRKLLIINADDFGYSVSRNIGMVECFTKGVISGVTLMVNGVADEDAAKRAKESKVPTGIYIRRTICV